MSDPVAKLAAARLAGQDISAALERVAVAAEGLLPSGLDERAIVVLLQARIGGTKVTRNDIRLVLNALPGLRDYIKEKE